MPGYFSIFCFIGIPEGIFDAILAQCKLRRGFMSTHNGIAFIFVALSGVLQGCTVSGSLFVIANDPLLHMLKVQLESSSLAWLRACADDTGTAMN